MNIPKAELMQFFQDRIKEPSTIRGLTFFLTGTGVFGHGIVNDITPAEALLAAGTIIAGLIGIFTKDSKTTVVNAVTVEKADTVEQAQTVVDSNTTNITNEVKP